MKAYRIQVTLTDPNGVTATFLSPRVYLFHPVTCDKEFKYQDGFIEEATTLFITEYPKWTPEDIRHEVTYKSYTIHPFKDTWNRFIVMLKYHF